MKKITLTRPDDWHVHLRDGDALKDTVAHSARYFSRAIVMPNLTPPVTHTEAALAYRQRILDTLPKGSNFTPLMVLYLTDLTRPEEILSAHNSGHIYAAKYYPAGATTHSDSGVTAVEKLTLCLEAMAEVGMPLLIHGEVTDHQADIFDREKIFIEQILSPLCQRFPQLKIVLEHITTQQAVEFVQQASDNVAATITAHHLLYNRNNMLAGGIKPHFYCLPILKRQNHQQALLDAVGSGKPKFFLGTDSAPHSQAAKQSDCGCAGCFTAHAAIEMYAEVFDSLGALDKLEAFASFNGADFYGLPRNQDKIVLEQKSWRVASTYPLGDEQVIPLRANELITWTVHKEIL